MSPSVSEFKQARVQKVCTLWTHDDNFSRDDIVFNPEKFPELPASPGCLLQIVAIESGLAARDAKEKQNSTQSHVSRGHHFGEMIIPDTESHLKPQHRGTNTITIDENGSTIPGGRNANIEKAYIFVSRVLPADLKAKHTNLQVTCAIMPEYTSSPTYRCPSRKESQKCLAFAIGCRSLFPRYVHLPIYHVRRIDISSLMRRDTKLITLNSFFAMSILPVQTCGGCQYLSSATVPYIVARRSCLWVQSKPQSSTYTLTASQSHLATSRLRQNPFFVASQHDTFSSSRCPARCGISMLRVRVRSCLTK